MVAGYGKMAIISIGTAAVSLVSFQPASAKLLQPKDETWSLSSPT
jgi:hypothetical protein